MKEDWLELQCTENLPLITVDQVQQELRKINTNKAPGPYDPFMQNLKDLCKVLCYTFDWNLYSFAPQAEKFHIFGSVHAMKTEIQPFDSEIKDQLVPNDSDSQILTL